MKVALWAKILGEAGHVYLNTVEVPDGTREFYVPVREPIGVQIKNGGELPVSPNAALRIFRYHYEPVMRALDALPKFLEE